jgi:hypothetical protein
VVAAVGIAFAVWLFVTTLTGIFTGIHRFDSGETRVVQLDEGDNRAIYQRTDIPNVNDARCAVTGASLHPKENTDLTLNDEHYASLFAFEAPHTGDYAVRCTGSASNRFAVGPELRIGNLVVAIVLVVAALLLGPMIGITIVVVTVVLRHRRRPGAPGTA